MIQNPLRQGNDSSAWPAQFKVCDSRQLVARMSFFGLRLGQANHALALFELAALFHKLDPLKALQNAALGFDGALALQAGMLTHRGGKSG